MLTTLITAAIFLVGSAFDPDACFGYNAFLTPMRYAACCVIPTFVTYSRRELKKKEMMGRMLLELLLIEAVILYFAFSSPAIDTTKVSVILVIAGSVLTIYTLARIFSWLRDTAQAKDLNADLLSYQERVTGTIKKV